MADYTEEEIEARERIIEVLMEQSRTGEKGIDAQIKLYLETTKVGKGFTEVHKAAGKVTAGFKESAKAMGTGTANISDLSGAVTGTIDAISGLLGKIPILGKGLEAMGGMASELVTFGIGQVQANYDSFKELAKAGTIGAEGVTGMADQFMKAGLPLQTYTKLLTENSENLAYFSGTALQGGKDFSKLMGNMDKDSKQYMRNLGYGVEEFGESAIEWQVLQRQRGIRQQLSDVELSKGTATYVSELDALSKLTGQNVKELKTQRDQVRSDSRFRARLMKLNAEGNTEGAKNMELFAAVMKKAAPEIGQGFSDITSGAINTEAAQKLARSGMLDTAQAIQKGLETGELSQSDALIMMRDAANEASEVGGAMHGLAGFIENGTSPFFDLAQTATFGNKAIGDMTKLIEEQNKVRTGPDAATDALSTAMGSIEQTMANINQLFIAQPAAIKGLAKFSEGLDYVVQQVSDWANAEAEAKGGLVGGRPKTAMTSKQMKTNKAVAEKKINEEALKNIKDIRARYEAQGKMSTSQIDDTMNHIRASMGIPLIKPGEAKTVAAKPTAIKTPPAVAATVSGPSMRIKPDINIHDEIAKTTAKRDEQQAALQDYNKSAAEGGWSSAEKQEQKAMRSELLGIKMQLVTLVDIAKKQKNAAEQTVKAVKQNG